jgi:predicted CoA-substrate-specific enzyme activase
MRVEKVGIDIGSLYVKLVVIDEEGNIKYQDMVPHQGNPIKAVKELLEKRKLNGEYSIGVVGINSNLLASQIGIMPADDIQAQIHAVKRYYPDVRNIINIGGSSVTLIELDEDGNFRDYAMNSLCAAGTGSFLDQQASRLGINYSDVVDFRHVESPPSIAARCAVFAKSDLIHRQQEGYSKEAMWCGLCKGLTHTLINTLLRGRSLEGLTVVIGGVAQNKELMRWLKNEFGDRIKTFELAPYAGALGAAILANNHFQSLSNYKFLVETEERQKVDVQRKPLLLIKSKYPSFEVWKSYIDKYDNEVRITKLPEQEVAEVYIGIDIGSTSTKLIIIDKESNVLIDVYRKTLGEPIRATQLLFSAIEELLEKHGKKFKVLGVATTGSGRKLVGTVIGADLIVNEISAHVKGAMSIDNSIETIFEIGGQDSKYMRTKRGFICDANMNYVCAAGTGSFVEEQAKKLGFSLDEVGDIVMGITPPTTSDRCTVFMEQDAHKLIRQGYSKKEAMAAVMYSVVQNYLNKVVGKRYISKDKIFFQGATARNKGLVAAFENLLNVEIVVSPYCHVLGAHGAALLVREQMMKTGEKSKFKGLDLAQREIELIEKPCEICSNRCRITYAKIEGDDKMPSYGYMCGRDPEEEHQKTNENYSLFTLREKIFWKSGSYKLSEQSKQHKLTIGLPLVLSNFIFMPLWRVFFAALGYKTKVTTKSDEKIVESGSKLTGADFCFPVKIAYGHIEKLLNDNEVKFIFLPYMISSKKHPFASNNYFCPYVQSLTSHIKTSTLITNSNKNKLIAPIIDFAWDDEYLYKTLYQSLSDKLDVSLEDIKKAFRLGMQAYNDFKRDCQLEGEKALNELKQSNQKGIIILGRMYNTIDERISLNLARKIADLGIKVIPLDFVPFNPSSLDPTFYNMYWTYGQWIINAARLISQSENLFGIFFTNYSCGPDSFILSYVEEIMGEKPLLILELDEHSGDAGYMTRIEAFLDVVKQTDVRKTNVLIYKPKLQDKELKNRTIWIPCMHPVGSRLFAAGFRGYGYKAEALPPENKDTFDIGRALTRGSECLPMAVTIGSLVHKLKSINAVDSEHAFFMPTANGPCRFGQYELMQRIILNRLGYKNLYILSPSSANAYAGLEDEMRRYLWKALLVSDILFKYYCKIKPYEKKPGETKQVLEKSIQWMEDAFEKRKKLDDEFQIVKEWFASIEQDNPHKKPLVGIVGEIFVRCNVYSNNNLIEEIENFGGEAWLVPISEWVLYTAYMQKYESKEYKKGVMSNIKAHLKNHFLHEDEKYWYKLAGDLLKDRQEPPVEEVVKAGAEYVPMNFGGEAILTVGRSILFKQQNAQIIVNVSPFTCMPGTITSAIFQRLQQIINIPIVSMFYDGEESMSHRLQVFLNNINYSK